MVESRCLRLSAKQEDIHFEAAKLDTKTVIRLDVVTRNVSSGPLLRRVHVTNERHHKNWCGKFQRHILHDIMHQSFQSIIYNFRSDGH